MAEHAFSLILSGGVDACGPALLQAAGDDIAFASDPDRRIRARVARESNSAREAIRSAIEALEAAGARVREVESAGCRTTIFNAALDLRDGGAHERAPSFAALAACLGIRCDPPPASPDPAPAGVEAPSARSGRRLRWSRRTRPAAPRPAPDRPRILA